MTVSLGPRVLPVFLRKKGRSALAPWLKEEGILDDDDAREILEAISRELERFEVSGDTTRVLLLSTQCRYARA